MFVKRSTNRETPLKSGSVATQRNSISSTEAAEEGWMIYCLGSWDDRERILRRGRLFSGASVGDGSFEAYEARSVSVAFYVAHAPLRFFPLDGSDKNCPDWSVSTLGLSQRRRERRWTCAWAGLPLARPTDWSPVSSLSFLSVSQTGFFLVAWMRYAQQTEHRSKKSFKTESTFWTRQNRGKCGIKGCLGLLFSPLKGVDGFQNASFL